MSIVDTYKKRLRILVPEWIVNQLKRNSLPLKTVLDLEKMLTISSAEDLSIMLSMNADDKYTKRFFGCAVQCDLYGYWDTHYNRQCKALLELRALYQDVVDQRLFSVDTDAEYPLKEDPDAFKITPIEGNTHTSGGFVITIYPNHFGQVNAADIQNQLVREYLKQSYVFSDYDKMSNDVLFDQYVSTLQASL